MKRTILGTLLILWAFAGPVAADDLEIFGGKLVNLKPNIMIIFDTSMSMATNNRIGTAKTVIKQLVDETDGVRFGVMAFNTSVQGGYVVYPCTDIEGAQGVVDATKTVRTDIKSHIDGLSANVPGTPLAETLAEAGLYFAAESSWYATSVYVSPKYFSWYSGGKYISPIQYACQKNHIIILTDGLSRDDNDNKLYNVNYVGGVKVGDQDGDNDASISSSEPNGSHYLDDFAKFFQTHDMRPGWNPSGNALYDDQHITVHTIGFGLSSTYDLLSRTADANHGNGIYRLASDSNTAELKATFQSIVKNVLEANSIFAAPVIPLDRVNQASASSRVYMPFFKPQKAGPWIGNLKAYKLTVGGVLQDANDVDLTYAVGTQRYIKATAQSLWSGTVDGAEVDLGGAGALLRANGSRNIYTYLGNNDNLTDSSNAFTTGNTTYLTAAALGVAAGSRDSLITAVREEGGTSWPLGPIIHSVPHVETYADIDGDSVDDDFIFVGANDGMLHVFDADTGAEAWSLIPPGQLDKLPTVADFDYLDDYSVDGSPVIAEIGPSGSRTKVLIFGERRGGNRYYAVDVTDPLAPVWKFQIISTILNNAGGKLGQAWSRPQFMKVRSGGTIYEAFLLTGGYDAANQDQLPPASATDTLGRAIFTVRADTGMPVGLDLNGENWSEMTHSILDAKAFDRRGAGYIDRVYAGDLGGQLLAARYDRTTDDWERFVLLDLPATYSVGGVDKTLGRKFMTQPLATIRGNGECVYLGSGDREHLLSTTATDALYSVCNHWETDGLGNFTPVAGLLDPVAAGVVDPDTALQDKLVDITSNKIQDGTAVEQDLVSRSLYAGSGWFLRLEHAGEKIISTPLISDGKIFFKTHTPDNTLVGSDPCANNFDLGIARLYAVDYKTGGAVFNFDGTGDLTKSDRSIVVGTSLGYAPVLYTTDGVTKLLVDNQVFEVEDKPLVERYFWRQVR